MWGRRATPRDANGMAYVFSYGPGRTVCASAVRRDYRINSYMAPRPAPNPMPSAFLKLPALE